VLRFDYYGTGDSWGEGGEVTLTGFAGDALEAAQELRAIAGVEKVDFVGLRLGAYIASAVAAMGGGSNLVLWDPVMRGSEFLEALLGNGNKGKDEVVEVGGFPLPSAFQEELREASMEALPDLESRVLFALSDPAAAVVAETKRFSGSEPTVEIVASPPCWIEEKDFGAGAIPADLIRKIVTWL
jgi:pimeloyl-ACP methyl ester carboxylesterase